MPALLERYEYYWENDRLLPKKNRRESSHSKWPRLGNSDQLVAILDNYGKVISEGRAITSKRLVHAILWSRRLHANPTTTDIGLEVPSTLIAAIKHEIRLSVEHITDHFSYFSNEERITGALISELARTKTLIVNGWELLIFPNGFSSQKKEPIIGADLGIIIDLKKHDHQVSKAIWIQAKKDDTDHQAPSKLRDMDAQMKKMRRRTDDSYGMIYTPTGIKVFQGSDTTTFSLDTLIGESIECLRGDRSPTILAETVQRSSMVELAIHPIDDDTRPLYYNH